MAASDVAVALRDVERGYQALRPLRIRDLELRQGESAAVLGLDRAAAEVLVNLITAATLPDRGSVTIFGVDTATIADADHWLKALDDFGILSERVVLLDEMTTEHNLTLPLSLDIDEPGDALRGRVRQIAVEVGLDPAVLSQPAAALDSAARLRVRLGKALAGNPRVLLAEYPNAMLAPDDVAQFAHDLSGIISRRSLTALILTADRTFAQATAQRILTLQPATGELKASSGWRQWFRS